MANNIQFKTQIIRTDNISNINTVEKEIKFNLEDGQSIKSAIVGISRFNINFNSENELICDCKIDKFTTSSVFIKADFTGDKNCFIECTCIISCVDEYNKYVILSDLNNSLHINFIPAKNLSFISGFSLKDIDSVYSTTNMDLLTIKSDSNIIPQNGGVNVSKTGYIQAKAKNSDYQCSMNEVYIGGSVDFENDFNIYNGNTQFSNEINYTFPNDTKNDPIFLIKRLSFVSTNIDDYNGLTNFYCNFDEKGLISKKNKVIGTIESSYYNKNNFLTSPNLYIEYSILMEKNIIKKDKYKYIYLGDIHNKENFFRYNKDEQYDFNIPIITSIEIEKTQKFIIFIDNTYRIGTINKNNPEKPIFEAPQEYYSHKEEKHYIIRDASIFSTVVDKDTHYYVIAVFHKNKKIYYKKGKINLFENSIRWTEFEEDDTNKEKINPTISICNNLIVEVANKNKKKLFYRIGAIIMEPLDEFPQIEFLTEPMLIREKEIYTPNILVQYDSIKHAYFALLVYEDKIKTYAQGGYIDLNERKINWKDIDLMDLKAMSPKIVPGKDNKITIIGSNLSKFKIEDGVVTDEYLRRYIDTSTFTGYLNYSSTIFENATCFNNLIKGEEWGRMYLLTAINYRNKLLLAFTHDKSKKAFKDEDCKAGIFYGTANLLENDNNIYYQDWE